MNTDPTDELTRLRAENAELKAQVEAFESVSFQVVPGEHGQGEEIPCSPDSLKRGLEELQEEWDGADRRAFSSETERDGLRSEVERLTRERDLQKGRIYRLEREAIETRDLCELTPEEDALIQDLAQTRTQLRLCEEHAGTMAKDFDASLSVVREEKVGLVNALELASANVRNREDYSAKLEASRLEICIERDSLRAQLSTSCKDWAEDDTAIKAICARFAIPDNDMPGYHKSCVECVEELAAKLLTITAERDEWHKEASQHLTDSVKLTVGFNKETEELQSSINTLTAAAVVKDGALILLLSQNLRHDSACTSGQRELTGCICGLTSALNTAKAALSPDAANPLLADVQAAAVALKELVALINSIRAEDYFPDSFTTQPATAALARLARWITPAIEQKLANPPATP